MAGLDQAATGRFEGALRSLSRELPRLRSGTATARLAALRRVAVAEGLLPAAEVAAALAAALNADPAGTPLGSWLEAIDTAAACGRGDAATAALVMATVGVRLAG